MTDASVSQVSACGVHVAVETLGHGRISVLLVHGLGANRGCWYLAKDYFDPDRYRLISPDFPGFGESSRADDFDYSMNSFGECLYQVVKGLEPGPLHIVAHSMGCVAALAMLESHPVELASFTAAEGNLIAEDAFMSSKVARLAESTFLRTYSKWLSMVRSSLGNAPNEQHDRFLESLRTASPAAVHRASLSCNERTRSGALSQQFAQLNCPIAYIYGSITPAQRPLPEVVSLPRVARHVVEGQGHFMMEDAPSFYGYLRAWIARNSDSSPSALPPR